MASRKPGGGALGIDLGSTIICTAVAPRVAFEDSFRVIKRLVDERFGENVFIVSKVNEEQQKRVEEFIKNERLCEQTGISRDKVFFCRERHEKAPICEKLGVTHFIDDRPEVLSHMDSVQNRILFQGIEVDFEIFKPKLSGVIRVENWKEIERLLLS